MSRPHPVGSPFGFKPGDWETVDYRRSNSGVLYVVLGYQFRSKHYESGRLKKNVRDMFQRAVDYYNKTPGKVPATLDFRGLAAGYGSHVFNAIARDIIGSDIAVFDTSDLNPNVMLEFGVALTWDKPVLPIRQASCKPPPSDVSGQTWAVYHNSAGEWPDTEHRHRIGLLVERALRDKRRLRTNR